MVLMKSARPSFKTNLKLWQHMLPQNQHTLYCSAFMVPSQIYRLPMLCALTTNQLVSFILNLQELGSILSIKMLIYHTLG